LLTTALMPAEAYISGIDLRHVDRAIRLQDDLFRARNGGWLASTPVQNRVTCGTYLELGQSEADVRAITERVAAEWERQGGSARQMAARGSS
jgi:putative endopeptidase